MTEIEKLIEKTELLLATAGLSKLEAVFVDGVDGWEVRGDYVVASDMPEEDAQLFAYAPTALRALVDEAQGLQHSLADAMAQIDAIQGSNAVHMSRVAELTQTLEEVQEALRVSKSSVVELEAALAKEKEDITARIIAAHKAGYRMAIDERGKGESDGLD